VNRHSAESPASAEAHGRLYFHRNGFYDIARLGRNLSERLADQDGGFPHFGGGGFALLYSRLDPLDQIGKLFYEVFPELFQMLGVFDLLGHAMGQLAERSPIRTQMRLQFFQQ